MKNGFVVLLTGVVAFILVSPLADEGVDGRLFVHGAFLILIVIAMRASHAGPRTWIALLLLLGAWLAAAGALKLLSWDDAHGKAIQGLVAVLICLTVFAIVGRAIVVSAVVDTNVICGGIACYLLIAVVWAISFGIIEWLHPGSFNWRNPGDPEFGELMYFSMTCITTLGFGDILPLSDFARIFATLETATGMIFISAFIARLVSLYRR